ncbi:YopX family protein [Lysinibacillus telephonicus]|uniref:YopX family protein n=1 Tax=Lysinibacillus telephonicus TaxID=1714840 RepID=UPI0037D641D5
MREIKFRAWSNKYNQMFRVNEICMTRDGYIHGTVDAGFKDEYHPTTDKEWESPLAWIGRVDFVKSSDGRTSGLFQNPNDEPFILMQYTGVKDHNGKEICEGDIVKSATQNNVIEYQHGSFMVLGLHEDKYERTFSTLYHFLIDATIPNVDGSRFDGVTTNLEVIGNIYEHPYLLEGAAG